MGLRLLNKIRWSLKTYGPVRAFYWMIFGYFRINTFNIYCWDLTCLDEKIADDTLEIVVASQDDIAALQKTPSFQTYESYVNTYLKSSACIIGYFNGEPAHVMWVFGKGDDSRLFLLGNKEAELNYCYTSAEFRGKGIYTRMIGEVARLLKKQGMTHLVMGTHESNMPANNAISRAGLKRIGSLTSFGIFYRPKWKTSQGKA